MASLPRASDEQVTRKAGRGGVAVLGAKAFFVVIGLVQQVLLPKVITLAGYGALSRVMAMANVVNNVMIGASLQGVSRAVARQPGAEETSLRGALREHVPLAIVAGTLFAVSAPAWATFQGAPHIRLPLMAMAAVTFLYGIYAPLVGALNGRAEFVKQASLDVGAATLRTLGLVGGGALFVRLGLGGPLGAVSGAAFGAAIMVCPAALWALRRPATRPAPEAPEATEATCATGPTGATGATEADAPSSNRSAVPANPAKLADAEEPSAAMGAFDAGAYRQTLLTVALTQLFTNLLMQVDISLLGRFLSLQSATTGLPPDQAMKAADEAVAVYRACQLFAFLPYQLLMSITQVLFPLLARAQAQGNTDGVRTLTTRGARLGTLACALFVAVLGGLAPSLLRLAFGPVVADQGASSLRILVVGQGAFTLFGLAASVLTSLGQEKRAAVASLGASLLVALACWLTVPHAAFGVPQLQACATATTVSLLLALGVGWRLAQRAAGGFVPWRSAGRAMIAAAAVASVGQRLPSLGLVATGLAAAGLGALYIILLVALGELGAEDRHALKTVLRRRSSSSA